MDMSNCADGKSGGAKADQSPILASEELGQGSCHPSADAVLEGESCSDAAFSHGSSPFVSAAASIDRQVQQDDATLELTLEEVGVRPSVGVLAEEAQEEAILLPDRAPASEEPAARRRRLFEPVRDFVAPLGWASTQETEDEHLKRIFRSQCREVPENIAEKAFAVVDLAELNEACRQGLMATLKSLSQQTRAKCDDDTWHAVEQVAKVLLKRLARDLLESRPEYTDGHQRAAEGQLALDADLQSAELRPILEAVENGPCALLSEAWLQLGQHAGNEAADPDGRVRSFLIILMRDVIIDLLDSVPTVTARADDLSCAKVESVLQRIPVADILNELTDSPRSAIRTFAQHLSLVEGAEPLSRALLRTGLWELMKAHAEHSNETAQELDKLVELLPVHNILRLLSGDSSGASATLASIVELGEEVGERGEQLLDRCLRSLVSRLLVALSFPDELDGVDIGSSLEKVQFMGLLRRWSKEGVASALQQLGHDVFEQGRTVAEPMNKILRLLTRERLASVGGPLLEAASLRALLENVDFGAIIIALKDSHLGALRVLSGQLLQAGDMLETTGKAALEELLWRWLLSFPPEATMALERIELTYVLRGLHLREILEALKDSAWNGFKVLCEQIVNVGAQAEKVCKCMLQGWLSQLTELKMDKIVEILEPLSGVAILAELSNGNSSALERLKDQLLAVAENDAD
eukprot:TRINITY_DN343_c0_g2_i1.p1 TRINITY_DN343_c0_g2~~TRINITY_DN343_c0_g2_i1.p1  ORF type:complete len:696 (+),score=157.55 TRINITY_DN343_c0_g2_i1:79-2166(+)